MQRMAQFGISWAIVTLACATLESPALPSAAPTLPQAQASLPAPTPMPAPSATPEPNPPPTGERPADCLEAGPHPISQSTAERYDVSAAEVMNWYCAGAEFDDILLALETNAQSSVPVEDLLARRAAGASWDHIWREIGLVD